jgi:hypothetical protein
MGCKYVDEFDFGPRKVQVKAYARGGPVRAPAVPAPIVRMPAAPKTPGLSAVRDAMPKRGKK